MRHRGIYWTFAVAAMFTMAIEHVSACSCIAPGPPLEEAEEVDAVFLAKVVTLRETNPDNSAVPRFFRKWLLGAPYNGYVMPEIRVEFEVLEGYKGTRESDGVLMTDLTSSACGYTHFREQQSFLIYAWRDESEVLVTGLCSRTTPAVTAADEISVLRRHYGIGAE